MKDPSESGEPTTDGTPGKTHFYELLIYKKDFEN